MNCFFLKIAFIWDMMAHIVINSDILEKHALLDLQFRRWNQRADSEMLTVIYKLTECYIPQQMNFLITCVKN
jgi:hypothetical protein